MIDNNNSTFHPQDFVANFYHALDCGKTQDAASAFAPNGVWQRKGEALTGPSQVADALEKRNPSRTTCHSISNFVGVKHDDTSWHTRYYLTVFDNQSETGMRIVAIMICDDQIAFINGQPKISTKKSQKLLP